MTKYVLSKSVLNFLELNAITKYTLNNYGLIDVDQDVKLRDDSYSYIAPMFGAITGFFSCSHMNLKTLKGSPRIVSSFFYCDNNQLKNLEGGPIVVQSSYSCSYNPVKSLKGSPISVGGFFICTNTNINSLEGISGNMEGVHCRHNDKIKTAYDLRHVLFSTCKTIESDFPLADKIINNFFLKPQEEKKQAIFRVLEQLKEIR